MKNDTALSKSMGIRGPVLSPSLEHSSQYTKDGLLSLSSSIYEYDVLKYSSYYVKTNRYFILDSLYLVTYDEFYLLMQLILCTIRLDNLYSVIISTVPD